MINVFNIQMSNHKITAGIINILNPGGQDTQNLIN